MPTETKSSSLSSVSTATEKPSHYRYLKEFRVEQCPLFPQHKCTQHRPFTCFNWHFPNQRRRRPVRKRDGTFNYSPDTYCTKYDETSGTCPEGDDCPFLHRTAGDTERRYHLRYFKTCMCVYETDTRGYCVKNGAHCAFAHGDHDKRPPVYDIRELQQTQEQELEVINGPNQLDKERNMMVDDPKWQDAGYVLLHYKTDSCKRPPRLCRQGYACPQYHNLRDRRRSPKKYKYRSTPCPNVKHGDEWGEPTLCDEGDECPYCHTRTEQQFHPEIYKSSKCNDVFTNQYCPRGPFCAFAHADHEMSINRNLPTDTNFADILSNVLPSSSLPGSGLIGPVGSKPGENNNINSNGNGSSISSSNSNNNTNGLEPLGFFSPGGISSSGMSDFSDVLRNACGSPLVDQSTGNGGSSSGGGGNFFGNQSSSSSSSTNTVTGGSNAPAFGVQSFASAVGGGTDRSNSANSSTASHGSKFFEDQPKVAGESINGPKGLGNNGGNSMGFYDTFDNMLGFRDNMAGDDQRDAYSLFPSAMMTMKGSTGVREDMSRGDSPSTTIDKDIETDHFSGGDFSTSLSPRGVSKPVSIPVSGSSSASGFFGRERFPSGSSSLTSSLNNSFSIGPLFSKPPEPSIEQKSELISNHLGSLFEYPSRQPPNNSTMPPSNSNGFIGGNGPGPIGSSGNNTNGNLINGNSLMSMVNRPDLSYQSTATLAHHLSLCKTWADLLTKALGSYTNKENPNYSCLNCKSKDRPRCVVVLPCDHQVLCANCVPLTRTCPLCGNSILSRKTVSVMPHIDL